MNYLFNKIILEKMCDNSDSSEYYSKSSELDYK